MSFGVVASSYVEAGGGGVNNAQVIEVVQGTAALASYAVSLASTPLPGDVLVAIHSVSTNRFPTATSGVASTWEVAREIEGGAGSALAVYRARVLIGTGPFTGTAVTFTANARRQASTLFHLRGVQAVLAGSDQEQSTSVTTEAVTPSAAGVVLAGAYYASNGTRSYTGLTPAAGWTQGQVLADSFTSTYAHRLADAVEHALTTATGEHVNTLVALAST